MSEQSCIVRVAVPTPIRKIFDYLLPKHIDARGVRAGCRVVVPFGNSRYVALVLDVVGETQVCLTKLKPIECLLEDTPLLSKEVIRLLNWVSQYYHHPIGEVYKSALPVLFRKIPSAGQKTVKIWRILPTGRQSIQEICSNSAKRQLSLLKLLEQFPQGLSRSAINEYQSGAWFSSLKKLEAKGWVECIEESDDSNTLNANRLNKPRAIKSVASVCKAAGPELNHEQLRIVQHLIRDSHTYCVTLIDGITGSGKTEVYLSFIQHLLSQGLQVLVLVPEIGLTPQLLYRFEQRLAANIKTLHSGLNNTHRMKIWRQVVNGDVEVLIGTRSAVFTPMPRLGAIIIDEEHDVSFKQQDSIRYSAKDVAYVRAKNLNIPLVLGSATPSFESLHNAQHNKLTRMLLRQRAGKANTPQIHIIDIRGQNLQHGLSRNLINLMQQHLQKNNQVLLFQNRRGYAPVLICNKCGWISYCQRCDAKMTYHRQQNILRCHHCLSEQRIPQHCPDCQDSQLSYLGVGTERVEKVVKELFADVEIVRIDRDTTRRKNALEDLLNQVKDGVRQILIGTQMLAKGHHFPNVTLVAVLDIDQGLYSVDYRAQERLAQLLIQVAGRAGRADKKGQVILQTTHPDDPMLQSLLQQGYEAFARRALQDRQSLSLPPYAYQALIRCESSKLEHYQAFLQYCYTLLCQYKTRLAGERIELYGPVPAPMERKAGKYRGQLLIQSMNRKSLHQSISALIRDVETNKQTTRVRWSIDIDPQELY